MQRHEFMDMKYYFNILQRILIIWREGSKGRFGVELEFISWADMQKNSCTTLNTTKFHGRHNNCLKVTFPEDEMGCIVLHFS